MRAVARAALGRHRARSDRFWVSSCTYWLWPLPADGSLTIVADWPQLDLADGAEIVDGSDLAASAGRARQIWPACCHDPPSTSPVQLTRVPHASQIPAREIASSCTADNNPRTQTSVNPMFSAQHCAGTHSGVWR